jgi:hypothetical protein
MGFFFTISFLVADVIALMHAYLDKTGLINVTTVSNRSYMQPGTWRRI